MQLLAASVTSPLLPSPASAYADQAAAPVTTTMQSDWQSSIAGRAKCLPAEYVVPVKDEDLARVSPLLRAHTVPGGSYFQSPRRRRDLMPEPVMA